MSTPRTLVVVAHPDLAASRINATLAEAVRNLDHVTVHDQLLVGKLLCVTFAVS